jgi:hypothetical protein
MEDERCERILHQASKSVEVNKMTIPLAPPGIKQHSMQKIVLAAGAYNDITLNLTSALENGKASTYTVDRIFNTCQVPVLFTAIVHRSYAPITNWPEEYSNNNVARKCPPVFNSCSHSEEMTDS